MHPHDQAIEAFYALNPDLFVTFVRLDLCEQYSLDIDEQESLLQLWFCSADIQSEENSFLHLSCYGVVAENDFHWPWPCRHFAFQLKMKSIRQHYLEGLFFELSYLDSGYDEYIPLLTCRRFEAKLEKTLE